MLASQDIPPVALRSLLRSADHAAARFCRQQFGLLIEQDDVRQDLLLDLLARLDCFDPTRSSLPFFAAVCFRHRVARLSVAAHRDRQARSPVELDMPRPGSSASSLLDTLADSDGYSAWIGQPTDETAELDRRLDLDRALSAMRRDALPICAALMKDEPDPAASAGMSRTTFYRRVHEVRCQLLAAGIDGRRGTDRRVAG